jgi:RsiW-degrading membrane proteinase PrsW (M82 family)
LLAVIIYVRATRPKNRTGILAFWIGTALLTWMWYKNITAGIDPNPVKAGMGGLIVFSLVVAWAYWINRLRLLRAPGRP